MTDDQRPLLLDPVVYGRQRQICCHRAGLTGTQVPNSLNAIDECLSAHVPRLEVDVRFIADGAMLVFHDSRLEHETTGEGPVEEQTRESLSAVRFRADTSVQPCFLEDVVDRMAGSGTVLQVDLKQMRPLTIERARALEAALAPMDGKVIVGSQAHWNLRRLYGVPVALDPSLQWRFEPQRLPEGLPRSLGTHGLWDDSPLATSPFVTPGEYISARIDDLVGLLPQAAEWMVDIDTILHLMNLGTPLGEVLRERGISLAAWTLQATSGDPAALLEQLYAAGVETVITDIPLIVAAVSDRVGIVAA